jgi:uncharacterized membrane protein YfcA
VGGYLGSHVARRIDERALRIAIAAFSVVVAVILWR